MVMAISVSKSCQNVSELKQVIVSLPTSFWKNTKLYWILSGDTLRNTLEIVGRFALGSMLESLHIVWRLSADCLEIAWRLSGDWLYFFWRFAF